mmetsp:Transcript_30555/g.63804  ORF Transcript_30555/g.63804 Transcript_30555/m.63804 type:complete len:93 (-) Transcript_30555:64-342(-)
MWLSTNCFLALAALEAFHFRHELAGAGVVAKGPTKSSTFSNSKWQRICRKIVWYSFVASPLQRNDSDTTFFDFSLTLQLPADRHRLRSSASY